MKHGHVVHFLVNTRMEAIPPREDYNPQAPVRAHEDIANDAQNHDPGAAISVC